MATDQWRQVDQLFHAALERPAAERAAFLTEACAGDEALRRELESLLGAHEETGGFFEMPPADLAADWLNGRPASLVGQRLGHYQILSVLGKGGMGEVYLARDERLERQVALKLLPTGLTAEAERVRRFIREAKAASALNHPNIITIHEIGQSAGRHFIVTEYVDGQTLREHLGAAGLPLRDVLDVAIQVAGALSTAHEAGIVHRDIKPENLMLRRDRLVKVLDFGLAKLAEREATEPAATPAPTNASRQLNETTEPGLVMGTASYMSPEQARGQKVDSRTDIFSLGVVLYEMLAGRVPFTGVNAIEVMGAILNQEPPSLSTHLAALPPELARRVGQTVARALSKECAQRYQTSNELLLELKQLRHHLDFPADLPPSLQSSLQSSLQYGHRKTVTAHQPAPTADETDAVRTTSSAQVILAEVKRHKRGVALTLIAALAVATVLGVMVYRTLNHRAPTAPIVPLNPVPFSNLPGREDHAAFSPDGKQMAFIWDGGAGSQSDIYVKLVGVGAPLRLTTNPGEEYYPTWSPDGRYIAFLRLGQKQDEIIIVPALGGPERRLCSISTTRQRLSWSPDGQWLAVGDNLDGSHHGLVRVEIETGAKHALTRPPPPFDDSQPVFAPDGQQLVFVRSENLTATELYLVAADGSRERLLVTGCRRFGGADWTADGQAVIFSSLCAGTLTLWRVPRAGGKPTALSGVGWNAFWPAVARHGKLLAYTEIYDDTSMLRLELPAPNQRAGAPTELFSFKSAENSPQISPDGMKIAFVSDRSGSQEIWVCDRDGGNQLQVTHMPHAEAGSPRWSPDSEHIVFDARLGQSGDLFVVNAAGGTPRRLTTDSSHDVLPSWSHDGQWIYFCSNRGGDFQIWKLPAAGGGALQMTRHGGFEAFEAPDGQTLYYSKWRGIDGLWSVPVAGGAEQPVAELAQAGYWRAWSVTKGGIYYVAHTGAAAYPLKFFSFATRQTTTLGAVEKTPPWYVASLTAAPDGRWLLYAQLDRQVSTLMLVENFR